ncbi:hypothetical protein F0562_005876 [Nyssa sinensis]|uniref:Uncharacterized protein n=1 Tax=Nyssa sinensis TaxID=561372 RepID=A0A5J5AKN3_9ASTE|nr:hypothetical protein F0562_005876 [Nyssa sinensis]
MELINLFQLGGLSLYNTNEKSSSALLNAHSSKHCSFPLDLRCSFPLLLRVFLSFVRCFLRSSETRPQATIVVLKLVLQIYDFQMISLNIVSLISGAMSIGDLEERIEAILEEISAAKG